MFNSKTYFVVNINVYVRLSYCMYEHDEKAKLEI